MHKGDEVCAAELPGRKRRKPFGPWWMHQPAPSALGYLLLLGVLVFMALVLPAAQNLLFGPDFSVRFVLPNDYVGEFKVVLDPSQGEDYVLKGREFVFRIPANGILRVISDGPLNSFDRQIAVYEDGREVVFEALAGDGVGHHYRVERPPPRIEGQQAEQPYYWDARGDENR